MKKFLITCLLFGSLIIPSVSSAGCWFTTLLAEACYSGEIEVKDVLRLSYDEIFTEEEITVLAEICLYTKHLKSIGAEWKDLLEIINSICEREYV